MITRREFGALTLGGLVAGVRLEANTVSGVRLGVQTYSFRDLPHAPGGDAIDPVIKAMTECELTECELFAPQVEPQFDSGPRGARGGPPSPQAIKAREDLRKWRLEKSLGHFSAVKKKVDAAGVFLYPYKHNPNT